VIVIGCGKSKLARRAPARELYTGSLFVMARRYAEASGQLWAILSAKHGLLLPDQHLDPYDDKLALRGAELEQWARRAAERCVRLIDATGTHEKVECLAGHAYAKPFMDELYRLGVRSSEPLVGLGLGQRLGWLKAHTRRGR
jgi:hypothetical protein